MAAKQFLVEMSLRDVEVSVFCSYFQSCQLLRSSSEVLTKEISMRHVLCIGSHLQNLVTETCVL